MKVLYCVHDLHDSTVRKRVRMMQHGGAHVTVMGFRRGEHTIDNIHGAPVYDLGQTYNANFAQRVTSVFKAIFFIHRYKAAFQACDAIVARNLEMLAIAVRGASRYASKAKMVYEVLDIHRLLLRHDIIGRTLRRLEGWLSRRANRLWVSSPAFIHSYFDTLSDVKLPVTLIENKVFDPEHKISIDTQKTPSPLPWKIGCFGAIRCRKSLEVLCESAARSDGKIEVIIRGKPSYDQFDDFDKIISKSPGIRFEGPYSNPDDLANIYSEVHFTWAIDMFEEGLNSSWLLPNRLYEGGLFGTVPLVRQGVETAQYCQNLGIGLVLPQIDANTVLNALLDLSQEDYKHLKSAARNIPQERWLVSDRECQEIVESIKTS